MINAYGKSFDITLKMKHRIDKMDISFCRNKLIFEVVDSDLFCGDNFKYFLVHLYVIGGLTIDLCENIYMIKQKYAITKK